MRRPLARLLAFALLCALLAGWQAALIHPLQHLGSDGNLVHVEDGHHSPAGNDDAAERLSCDALAALASCVGSDAVVVLMAPPGIIAVDASGSTVAEPSATVVYPSQAPPLA